MLKFALPISPPSKIQGLVAGNLSDGGGEEIPIIYPATGEQISTLIEDDEQSVDKAEVQLGLPSIEADGLIFQLKKEWNV